MNPLTTLPTLRLKVAQLLKRLYTSQFIRNASLVMVLSVVSKTLAFFASAFAAKSMGPVHYGISGIAHTSALQVGLLYYLGLDIVAIRRIAANKYADSTCKLIETIITLRLCIASAIALIWTGAVWLMADELHKMAWTCAGVILWLNALQLNFVFTAIEKMPTLNAIQTFATSLSALGIFLVFKPGAPAGLDLVFTATSTAIIIGLSWMAYWREFGRWPVSSVLFHLPTAELQNVLSESWKYFVTVLVLYLFTFFQIPLIEMLSSTHEAGIYRTAFALTSGLDYFLQSFYLLLFPRVIAWKEQNEQVLAEQQQRALLLFSALGVAIAIVVWIGAPIFYKHFLGREFLAGVDACRILMLAKLTGFAVQIYIQLLMAMKRDTDFMIISCLGAAISLTLSLLLIPSMGGFGAACAAATGEMIINASSVLWFRKLRQAQLAVAEAKS
jgi:PST family polysaccharide transporter